MTQPVNDPPAPVGPAPRRRVPVGAIVLIVVGAALCLLALLPTVAGGFLLWAHATQRDADGYFTTSTERFETTSYAVTSDEVDLGRGPGSRDRVADLGSQLDDRVVASMRAADDVVIVVTPDFPTLKATHSFFEYLNENGSHITEPTIVVNEIYALQTLTPGDIENALGRRVAIRIPYDPLLYLRAANQGTPVFAAAPTSQPARRYDQLAAILLGEDAPVAVAEQRRRGLAGIFGRG